MNTHKTSTETPERKQTEADRRAKDERQDAKSEPLDEKSLDEVVRDSPL